MHVFNDTLMAENSECNFSHLKNNFISRGLSSIIL